MTICCDQNGIYDTDYYQTHCCTLGIPWAWICDGVWHVLVPTPKIQPPSMVYARPVTCWRERGGWRWRLELPEWRLPLYDLYILPRRPRLPEVMTRVERKVVFYHRPKVLERRRGDWTPDPLQVWASCPLWIVRDKKPPRRWSPRIRWAPKGTRLEGPGGR